MDIPIFPKHNLQYHRVSTKGSDLSHHNTTGGAAIKKKQELKDEVTKLGSTTLAPPQKSNFPSLAVKLELSAPFCGNVEMTTNNPTADH